MTKDHKLDVRAPASRGELTEDQLERASGGQKAVAPRTPYRATRPGAALTSLSIEHNLC